MELSMYYIANIIFGNCTMCTQGKYTYGNAHLINLNAQFKKNTGSSNLYKDLVNPVAYMEDIITSHASQGFN